MSSPVYPARDLGPRLFIALAGWDSVAFNGGRVSDYWWVPVLGPLLGAQIGALLYLKLISPHLPR
ncbi:aquaporin [Craterilacuibacter sinensis]|uniref:aquaporin n=1 Tax=Craterilacuibacter sinensis TaxID=2686017 RepID=UPI001C80D74E|nr:aquaporin [Craterilacuibacter sinensis]